MKLCGLAIYIIKTRRSPPKKNGGHMPKYLSFALTALFAVNAFAQTEQ